jgi:hypothetical protein
MSKRMKYSNKLGIYDNKRLSNDIILMGPGPLNDSAVYSKKIVEYVYPSTDLVNFSVLFSEEILLNGKKKIDLSRECTPEEFHCFNVLLNSVIYPKNSFVHVNKFDEYISGSIDLLLKTKSYKPIFDYFM